MGALSAFALAVLTPFTLGAPSHFSEWTSMFPDLRLCRALVDRMTHKAHIIETGKRSIRLEQSLKRKTKGQRSMVSQGEAERKEESTTKERR